MTEDKGKKITPGRALLEFGLLSLVLFPCGWFAARLTSDIDPNAVFLALPILALSSLLLPGMRRRYGAIGLSGAALAIVLCGFWMDPWERTMRNPNDDFAEDWSIVGSVGHAPITVNGFSPVDNWQNGTPVLPGFDFELHSAVLHQTNFGDFRFATSEGKIIDSRVEIRSDSGFRVSDWEHLLFEDGQFLGLTEQEALEEIKLKSDGEWLDRSEGQCWLPGQSKAPVVYSFHAISVYGTQLRLGNSVAIKIGTEGTSPKVPFDEFRPIPILEKHFHHFHTGYQSDNIERPNSRDLHYPFRSKTYVRIKDAKVAKIWADFIPE